MSFLAPLFLLGALAIAGPIIFHLVRRTTRERTVFSSVMFFSTSRPRLTRRNRLEHLLLLLLRALALGLLALGFARPFFRSAAAGGGAAAPIRHVAVLLDVSASMRRSGLWTQAQSRAASILGGLGPGDQAELFTFSRTVTPLMSFEEWEATPVAQRAVLAASRLAKVSPGWEEDRLGDALIRAADRLANAGREKTGQGPRQIYLISDLKAGSRLDSLELMPFGNTEAG